VISRVTSSTSGNATGRLRAAGTDNTTASSYIRQRVTGDNTTVATERTTDNKWFWFAVNTVDYNMLSADIFGPFEAQRTGYVATNVSTDNTVYFHYSGGHHTQTVSYDGFSLVPVSGTITGTISVYGYRD
jgi:hypothetical protein